MTKFAIPGYLETRDAAPALMRQEGTLRKWAWSDTGPVKPIRINGRLAWPVDQIIACLTPASDKPVRDWSGEEKAHLLNFLSTLQPDRLAQAVAGLDDDDKALVATLLSRGSVQ